MRIRRWLAVRLHALGTLVDSSYTCPLMDAYASVDPDFTTNIRTVCDEYRRARRALEGMP